MDIDDYINSLIKKNEDLTNLIESLRLEVRTQRKEIAQLREERRIIINNDLPPGFDPEWNIPNSEDDATKLGLR